MNTIEIIFSPTGGTEREWPVSSAVDGIETL